MFFSRACARSRSRLPPRLSCSKDAHAGAPRARARGRPFRGSGLGEERGSFSSSSSLAGKARRRKKNRRLLILHPGLSLARRPLSVRTLLLVRTGASRLSSSSSRARFFGRKRRRTRGKGGRAHVSLFLERKKKKPFAQEKRRRRRRKEGRRRKRPLPLLQSLRRQQHSFSHVNPSHPYLPADDDDRGQHVPQARQALVASGDVAERRRGGLQAVDERQDRLHPFGRHF